MIGAKVSLRLFVACRVPSSWCRASSSAVKKPPNVGQPNDFKIVYRFPYIVGLKALCRLKLYQTGFTTLLVPAAAVGNYTGLVPPNVLSTALVANVIALGMLYVMGEFFRRFIGIVYINERTNEAKIAHLTFFGNRKDVIVPLRDLVPLSESGDDAADFYFKLKRFSTKDVFYMTFRSGGVLDKELLESSLGCLPTGATKNT